MRGEFDLVQEYFQHATSTRADVLLGIGDDCALLQAPQGQQLAVSMDTLVCGRHFVADVDPVSLGHKALAVNLSDLAAMGAEPAWATLSLTLPDADIHWQNWLQGFMAGFSALAERYQVQLVGGDTTSGPLSISLQIHGFVPHRQALRRAAAQIGDLVYVSGTLGDAGLALQLQQQGLAHNDADYLLSRLNRPIPRVELGLALRGIANSAIDLSDGLAGDLRHICMASEVGAQLNANALPLSQAVKEQVLSDQNWELPLSAGDDYELLFTVRPDQVTAIEEAAEQSDSQVTCIGKIQAGEGINLVMQDGQMKPVTYKGYDHFETDYIHRE